VLVIGRWGSVVRDIGWIKGLGCEILIGI